MRTASFCRRGQVSVETLLVFLIFLLVLGIVYFGSSRIVGGVQREMDMTLSKKSFNEFAGKIDEACLLGEGNVRQFKTEGRNVTLGVEINQIDESGIIYTSGNFSDMATTACEINIETDTGNGFQIENIDGKTLRIS